MPCGLSYDSNQPNPNPMKSTGSSTARVASLLLSLVLQLSPLLRMGASNLHAGSAPVVAAVRWLVSVAALGGVLHAVSGATGVTITQGGKTVKTSVGTNGVTFAGTRISIRSDQFGNALSYEFDGLPPGLSGSAQGVVTGVPTQPGEYPVTVTGWQTSRFSGFNFSVGYLITILEAAPAAPPQVTVPPSSQSGPLDGSVTLSVTASGVGLSYQWIKDGQELPGQTTATLVLSPLQSTDAGSYQVRISNALGSVTTTAVAVKILVPAPTLEPLPTEIALHAGEDFALTAVATGVEPIQYQWLLNGAELAAATTARFSRSAVDSSLAGALTVRATDAAGGVATSSPVALSVAAPPSLRWVTAGSVLEAATIQGRTYRLESRREVNAGAWSEAATTVAADSVTLWDVPIGSVPAEFWRIVVAAPAPGAE